MAALIVGLYDWLWLDERIGTITAEIETFATEQPACRRLMSVPGVGPVISIAMVAAVGDTEPRINR
jgi:transposase